MIKFIISLGENMLERIKSPAAFFRDCLKEVLQTYQVTISEFTESYIVHLMTTLSSPKWKNNNLNQPTLVDMIEAISETTGSEKARLLQDTGDYALVWSGIFREQLAYRKISLSYYMTIGENAYIQAGALHYALQVNTLGELCSELGNEFSKLSDALGESVTLGLERTDKGLVNLLDRFQKSGRSWMHSILLENRLDVNN
jgi:hypothetical protein